MSTLRWERRDMAAIALLLLAALLFHWPLITPDLAHRSAYPQGDFYDQFYAFATYEHDRLWSGEIPLWNPYTFGGHPFLADVQAAVFYPFSLLALLLSGSRSLSPVWLELEAIAHFFLAGLFTYLLVRRLTVAQLGKPRRGGAIISALAFSFGGYLTGYPPLQMAILETQVWLPLLLLLLDLGLSRQAWWPVIGGGVAWGMALLAGHPQSAMYVFYAALLYGVFLAWRARLPWKWALGAHLTWIGGGFGLAAVQLVPAWEFMRLSVRASASYEELAGGFGLRDLGQYLVPGAFTHWSPVYVGIFPLFLAAMACVGPGPVVSGRSGWRERGGTVFWAALALGSLVLSLGGKGFVYRLFYWAVPGFNLFRSQERAIYLTSFSLAVLAGLGWSWLSSGQDPWRAEGAGRARRGLQAMQWLGVAAAVVTGIILAAGYQQPGLDAREWQRRLLLWVGLTWASWGLARWLSGRGVWWAALSVVLVMADLATANMTTNLAPGRAEERIDEGAWLGAVLSDSGMFRIANEWGLPGNAGCWLRLQDLYGASPLRLQIHKTMADALPHWRLWQLFGAKYVATWEHDLPGPFPADRVAMLGDEWAKNTVYVHRLEASFARAWVVHQARSVDDLAILQELQDDRFDPYGEVLLSDPVPAGFEAAESSGADRVSVPLYAAERMVVEADLAAPGWLVVGEWYYPGWQVWVDGTRQTIYRADYGLRAVPLAAGVHQVEFRYRPVSFYAGGAISALTAIILVGALVFRRRFTKGEMEPSTGGVHRERGA